MLREKIMKRILVSLAAIAMVAVSFADYELYVSESPAGPGNQNPNTWGGVRRYNIDGAGVASAMSGIAKTQVFDPQSMVFNASGELFISNRHGNTQASSVGRFIRDGSNNWVSNGSVTGNSLFGVHGTTFNPITGEMFAGNVNGPISRFTDSGGTYTPNGTINSGAVRDVIASTDGNFVYVSTLGSTLRRFNIALNSFIDYSIGTTLVHELSWRNGDLYGASFSGGSAGVYKFTVDGTGAITATTQVASVANAIGVAFSPDGNEMFVSQHASGDSIMRFSFNNGTQNWDPNGSIFVGTSLGSVRTYAVPEPATLFALAGLIPLLRRRRKQ